MRIASLQSWLAALVMLIAVAPALAENRPPPTAKGAASGAPAPRVLTGKERLGAKWQDEQRVDNCKVPPDKRGSKPRPDACASAPPK